MAIRIGIVGYGNLGKGIESNLKLFGDMQGVAVFSRRNPADIKSSLPVHSYSDMSKFVGKIDVMIMCGGSATDLVEQAPTTLKLFNTVDSFDTHSKIPQYFADMDKAGKSSGKLGAISIGWDPGLFSEMRVFFEAVLPRGREYTFWGKGVSQGHSDAIRRVEGVLKGIQYTVPQESAIASARAGLELSTRQKHKRICYVVAREGADKDKITAAIKSMPNYFIDYDTEVHFVEDKEFVEKHSTMPHGGLVLRQGSAADGSVHSLEFAIKLQSNPMFTSSVLLAYARAVHRLFVEGRRGAVTVLDIPISYLSSNSTQDLLKKYL